MPITFNQTNTDAQTNFGFQYFCYASQITSLAGRACQVNGTLGSTEVTSGAPGLATDSLCFGFRLDVDSSMTFPSGTLTWNMNVTTANMNMNITEVGVCVYNSDSTVNTSIGTSGTISVSLSTTGVKTGTVSLSTFTLPSGGFVRVNFMVENTAMTTQNYGITPNQVIDTPWNQNLRRRISTGAGHPFIV